MDPGTRELTELILRWMHLIAGIMWIGNSLLFNWLDRNLVAPPEKKERPGFLGEIWLLHSGGFYEVEKKFLAPHAMPKVLHWFKWQAYTTWLTGVLLLTVVYYHGGSAMLVDPMVRHLTMGQASMIGLGVIVGGWVVYDLLWRSPLGRHERVATGVSLALGAGMIYGLTQLLSGRAAFIHVGAVLGTLMAGNVAMHIIPSQRELVRATVEGREQDPKYSRQAKQRSIHNNYMTFPLLFTMVSNHFPGTYSSTYSDAILGVLFVGGAGVRHVMNIRFTFPRWIPALAGVVLASIAAVYFLMRAPATDAAAAVATTGEKASFATVHMIIDTRCVPCHSIHPTDHTVVAPIHFDTTEEIARYKERIKVRAVISRTMPLGNKTQMTSDERDILARWLSEGGAVN